MNFFYFHGTHVFLWLYWNFYSHGFDYDVVSVFVLVRAANRLGSQLLGANVCDACVLLLLLCQF